MQKRLVDLTKSDSLNDSDYLFINHDDNPIQVSLPYFKQNVAPVDATLTEEGKAADAKATGDKINEINTNIESINTEIEGIKTDYTTKEELNAVSTSLTETQEDVSELSTSIENVKADYLTKSDAQNVYLTKKDASTISDKEFYEGRKYDGMTYAGKTSDKGIKLHSVKGKTSQKTTNGYQLFDASRLPTTSVGGATVTNNNDGTFTISGTGNLSEAYIVVYNCSKEESLRLLRAGIVKSNAENTIPQIRFGLRNPSNGTFVSDKYITSNKKNITLTEEDIQSIENGTNVLSFDFYANSGNTITPATVKPMIYIDGDGTWEQYTGGQPAPNPDYAMPIENVEISNITSHGRQLFDSSKITTKSQGGATATNNNDGSFTISGSGALSEPFSQLHWYTHEETLQLLKTGKIYVQNNNAIPRMCAYLYYDNNTNYYTLIDASKSESDITEEMLSKSDCKLRIYIYGDRGSAIKAGTIKPMLYQDGDGTWEPFKHATVETSLTLAQDDIYQQGTITRARKQVTFDGSSDEVWTLNPTWSKDPDYSYYYIKINDIKANLHSFISNRFKCIADKIVAHPNEEAIFKDSISTSVIYVSILKSRLSSTGDFREWLKSHSLEFEYELATPTTEEFKVPTIPSYYPFTNVSTDNDLETDMQWKILADCDNSLKQEELEKRILALETKAIE